MEFCAACGGREFCLTGCVQSTAQERYWQRTAYCARVMLQTTAGRESQVYWTRQLKQAEQGLKMQEMGLKQAA